MAGSAHEVYINMCWGGPFFSKTEQPIPKTPKTPRYLPVNAVKYAVKCAVKCAIIRRRQVARQPKTRKTDRGSNHTDRAPKRVGS